LRVRFLADANLDQDLVASVLRREPKVDFELPQGIIPEGMQDPEVLAVAASLGRILVTRCPPDATALRRVYQRSRLSGLILIPRSLPMGQAIEEILLIWHASDWRS